MTRRSIPMKTGLDGDKDLNQACEMVCSALQEADPERVDLSMFVEAAEIAACLPMELAEKRTAVFRYVQTLSQAHQTILRYRLGGFTARQIAQLTKTDHKSVCIALAVIYSGMQALVSRPIQ